MKLLLVNKLFAPVTGGVETVVGQIARGMAADADFSVTVLAGNEKPFSGTSIYEWEQACVIKTASAGTLYNTALSPAYFHWLKKLSAAADVVHFHVPNPLGELACSISGIASAPRVIVTLHADISQTAKKHFAVPYNFFLKKLLKRADTITTMTAVNRDSSPVLKDFLHKCTIIPNAYDQLLLQPVTAQQKQDFLHQFKLDAGKSIILFAGRLSKSKGINYLIDAVAMLENVQLLICGDGPERFALTEKAASNPNKIAFTGNLGSQSLACAYQVAQLFVLPSINETFGTVQAEALKFGLPVINTRLGTGVNTVSIHNETGLTVPPADTPALAAAINTILSNHQLANVFSKNALERAALYTPEKMLASFHKLYKGE